MIERMYPRETVDEALRLHQQGWTDHAIGSTLGTSTAAVNHWRNRRRRSNRFDRREVIANAHRCPVCTETPPEPSAYAHLLGLYLGDGYISPARHRTCALSIFCTSAYPRLINECRESMAAVLAPAVFTVQRSGCIEVKSNSRHWNCVFPQAAPGHKHSRPIALEAWQKKIVDEHPRRFVTGLFDSDGCRVDNKVRRKVSGEWRKYSYPRYLFSNTSADIHRLLGDALDLIGVEWKLNWKQPAAKQMQRPGVLSVARKSSVALLDTFIGPKG